MSLIRNKTAAIVLAYAYWPLAYFAIYVPFIVPHLDRWVRIPSWIVFLACLGFSFVLVRMGRHNSRKANLFQAIGIQVWLLLFFSLLSVLDMPGFKKAASGIQPKLPELLVPALLPILIMFALAEGGRILKSRNVPAS